MTNTTLNSHGTVSCAHLGQRHTSWRIVPLDTVARRHVAATLYRDVFGYTTPEDGISPRLLRGLLDNGGSAIGAETESGEMIGMSYGYSTVGDPEPYHYSQATAVTACAQGLGVGRALKFAQADVARRAGVRAMRWTFDPAVARNAHFNLETLGARGRWFYADYYGASGTDRMIVDWHFDAPPPSADVRLRRADAFAQIAQTARTAKAASAVASSLPPTGSTGAYRWLAVPARLPHAANEQQSARAQVRAACESAMCDGLSAIACSRVGDTGQAAYLFGEDDA